MSNGSHDKETTVLIVEDDADLADLYAAWLQDDYFVRTANDGDSALSALDDVVDVVLLDRRMPGTSGDEVLDEIRDRGFDCRVAMVTAVEPDFDIIDMGFDDYLVKPTTRDDLHETVQRLTTRREYGAKLNEYATLVTKRSALEAQKTETELDGNDEFEQLRNQIDELEEQVDPMARQLDADDAVAMFRDLPSGI